MIEVGFWYSFEWLLPIMQPVRSIAPTVSPSGQPIPGHSVSMACFMMRF